MIVYEVYNKVSSLLFTSRELAEKFVSGFSATIGFDICARQVIEEDPNPSNDACLEDG